jgi:hypothetical protein
VRASTRAEQGSSTIGSGLRHAANRNEEEEY